MSHPSFPGNIPAGGAATFSGWARNGQKPTPDDLTPEAQAYREYAQIQATLALAYEQRTANLIALAQLCVSIDGPTVDLSEDLQQITERLGMRAEK
ncbi:hypothetical protein [Glutamicibacter creatinolyticus]|uniref:hypothetical protein n=1 Tax=Glutamicibacter creatinolyticus TaxID=162496 RepID=UPI003217E390